MLSNKLGVEPPLLDRSRQRVSDARRVGVGHEEMDQTTYAIKCSRLCIFLIRVFKGRIDVKPVV